MKAALTFAFLLVFSFFTLFVKRVDASTVSYIHTNHQGSVVEVTDEGGNPTERERYYAYGDQRSTINSQQSIISERAYTGQIKDASSDLYYYNARYYDPALSTFISADEANDQLNRYAYVSWNPLSYIDPTGNYIDEGSHTPESDRAIPVRRSRTNAGSRGNRPENAHFSPVLNESGQVKSGEEVSIRSSVLSALEDAVSLYGIAQVANILMENGAMTPYEYYQDTYLEDEYLRRLVMDATSTNLLLVSERVFVLVAPDVNAYDIGPLHLYSPNESLENISINIISEILTGTYSNMGLVFINKDSDISNAKRYYLYRYAMEMNKIFKEIDHSESYSSDQFETIQRNVLTDLARLAQEEGLKDVSDYLLNDLNSHN